MNLLVDSYNLSRNPNLLTLHRDGGEKSIHRSNSGDLILVNISQNHSGLWEVIFGLVNLPYQGRLIMLGLSLVQTPHAIIDRQAQGQVSLTSQSGIPFFDDDDTSVITRQPSSE
jgi:hypothetical protein